MKIRPVIAALAVCGLLLPQASAAPWNAKEYDEGGTAFVINPGLPRDGGREIGATEMWRLGADEENDPLLGRITDVITDADGNAYLLDGNLSDIHVVDPSGGILRTIGGEGDGPGEFRNASELAFMPDGNIGVMEMMPGNVVVMDPFGEPRPSFRPASEDGGQGMMLPQHFDADHSGVVLGHISTNFGHDGVVTEFILGRYALDGTLVKALEEQREEQSGGNVSLSLGDGEDNFTGDWVLCADGRVVGFRYAFDYELQVYGPDGDKAMVIRREYETLRKPDAELAADRRRAEENNSRFSGVTLEVEERSRDISAVHARPGGMLWVATSEGARARTEGSLEVFDVIDRAGRFVQTLKVNGVEYDPSRDEYVIDGDRLYVFRESLMVPPKTTTSGGGGMQMVMITGSGPDPADEEDSGPLEVICYRIGG